MSIEEDVVKHFVDKLKKDFDEMIHKFDKGMDIIYNQPNPEVGLTPKETVYTQRRVKLYRYLPQKKNTHKIPLLIVYSLINGYYILDLLPEFSLVNFLLSEGFDVYIIHWDKPKDNEKDITFDYYISGYIKSCVEKIKELSGQEKINMLGYCMGGNMGMIYTACFPEDINAYINLAAPVDFDKGGTLRKWMDENVLDINRIVESFGNVPTYIMDMAFPWIKPSERLKAMGFLFQNPDNAFYARLYKALMQWREDNYDFPGKFARKFLVELYQKNKLLKGKLKIDGKTVNLKDIKCPVLNIVARLDYITPPESAEPFINAVSSEEKETLYIDGGHLDIVINMLIRPQVWPPLVEWLRKNSD